MSGSRVRDPSEGACFSFASAGADVEVQGDEGVLLSTRSPPVTVVVVAAGALPRVVARRAEVARRARVVG